MKTLNAKAKQISDGLSSSGLGFDPISLITILLPLLANCFKQTTSSQETPKSYLEDHYDEDTQSFDQSLVNRCRPQTRRAARKDGDRKLTRDQLDTVTVATLNKARTEDSSVVAAVMSEVE